MTTPKNILRTGVILVFSLLLYSSTSWAGFQKTKIAVLDFELHGNEMAAEDMGGIVAEWFTTTMVQAGRFDVIERAMLQKILDEQKLAMTGIVDEDSATKLGKLLGVQNVISGSVLTIPGSIEVNARIIDVESGLIVAAESVSGASLKELQQLVQELTQRIVSHFPITGFIVKKRDKLVTIDLGQSAGLNIGMEFFVYKEGEIIKHPKTGEVLDVEQIQTGQIKITKIRNKVAEGKVISEQGDGILYGQMVESISRNSKAQQPKKKIKLESLTIQTTPEDTKIRILNIGPRYAPKIKLTPGRYHVEVSKPSYQTVVKWIVLPPSESTEVTVFSISLVLSAPLGSETAPQVVVNGKSQSQQQSNKSSTKTRIVGDQDPLKSGGLAPDVLPLPTGSYKMGGNRFTEKPKHIVTINKSVFMMATEVTFADYMIFCEATNHPVPDDFAWGQKDRPVINVDWNDAISYAKWLTKQTGFLYRLPYENEWEWAARAQGTTQYTWGNIFEKNQANCQTCGSQWDNSGTAPVGSFAPNKFGFYDMVGNVWEWTQDCWVENYTNAPAIQSANLQGECNNRTVRGGAWNSPQRKITTSSRLGVWSNTKSNYIGFRLVKENGK